MSLRLTTGDVLAILVLLSSPPQQPLLTHRHHQESSRDHFYLDLKWLDQLHCGRMETLGETDWPRGWIQMVGREWCGHKWMATISGRLGPVRVKYYTLHAWNSVLSLNVREETDGPRAPTLSEHRSRHRAVHRPSNECPMPQNQITTHPKPGVPFTAKPCHSNLRCSFYPTHISYLAQAVRGGSESLSL